jgi:hypothetical protein
MGSRGESEKKLMTPLETASGNWSTVLSAPIKSHGKLKVDGTFKIKQDMYSALGWDMNNKRLKN